MLVGCVVCEREVEAEEAWLLEGDGEVLYFCSPECYEQIGEWTPAAAGWSEEDDA